MTDHEAKLLRALADGQKLRYLTDGGKRVTEQPHAALQIIALGQSHRLTVIPPNTHRFVPVHRMPAGTIVLAEAKCERKFATDDKYNGRGPSEKQVGVIHVEIDPETLELVSASMEKL